MSKHFSIFATESQWNAAKDSLDYPHVSLIDTTGDMHYATYTGQEVANAPFGSILMAEVATNKLFYIEDSADYNLTDYPLDDYKPIAVCIYDKASNANNETVFMSVQWANHTTLGQGQPSSISITWGFNNVDLSTKVPEIHDTGSQHISSKVINESMKPLITVDYSGTSYTGSTGDGSSAAFCTCWRYSTIGTNEGDWYLPSYYDVMKYQQNYASIDNVLTNIKNVAGTSYLNTANNSITIGCEYSASRYRTLSSPGSFGNNTKSSSTAVRPVFIASIEEL